MMDFETITPCGESCVGCKKKAEGFCQGCIASDGHCKEWEQSQGCPIYLCAKRHGAKFCGICPAFPCELILRKNIVSEMQEVVNEYRLTRKTQKEAGTV